MKGDKRLKNDMDKFDKGLLSSSITRFQYEDYYNFIITKTLGRGTRLLFGIFSTKILSWVINSRFNSLCPHNED